MDEANSSFEPPINLLVKNFNVFHCFLMQVGLGLVPKQVQVVLGRICFLFHAKGIASNPLHPFFSFQFKKIKKYSLSELECKTELRKP